MNNDEQDVEEMLKKWNDLEDLTIAGLHVMRDVVENAIAERTKHLVDYKPRVPLPSSPSCKLCWSCQTWIEPGERATRFDTGLRAGKTYHKECKP